MINVDAINQANQIVTSDIASKNQVAAAGTFSNLMQNKIQAPQTMDDIFNKASMKYGVPVNLLKAVGKAESDFNTKAQSRAGAQGVMQLMPGTAKELGVTDPFDPEQNIMGGAKYLRSMLDRYNGDAKLALAAYNAGANNVDKYDGIPPFKETQNYVVKVMQYAGNTIELPAYNTSSYGLKNAGSMDTRNAAATQATSAYAAANTGSASIPLNVGINNLSALQQASIAKTTQNSSLISQYPYASAYGSNISSGVSGAYDASQLDSATAALYANLLKSLQEFTSYSKDDYLFFLEQLKLNMNPASLLSSDSSNNNSQDYFLKSKMSYLNL